MNKNQWPLNLKVDSGYAIVDICYFSNKYDNKMCVLLKYIIMLDDCLSILYFMLGDIIETDNQLIGDICGIYIGMLMGWLFVEELLTVVLAGIGKQNGGFCNRDFFCLFKYLVWIWIGLVNKCLNYVNNM